MKPITIIITLVFCVLLSNTLFSTETIPLENRYLNQSPPTTTPKLFAPGIISTGISERDVAITPDGKEIYFSVMGGPHGGTSIMVMKLENNKWIGPKTAPFSGDPRFNDIEPHVSPDGKRFLFLSTRPRKGKEFKPGWEYQDIWIMDRTETGWSKPYNPGLPINTDDGEYFPSVTNDGTLYFTKSKINSRESAIYRSRLVKGKYTEPEKLPAEVNATTSQYNACISPNETYLIFCSANEKENLGPSDYYVCFRDKNDKWTKPINMGEIVNGPQSQASSPYVTPDGKYFFFSSVRRPDRNSILPAGERLTYQDYQNAKKENENGNPDIYWVSTDFIETLRPKVNKK